jgi:argininosuccinate lyase
VTLWAARLATTPAREMMEFTESASFDLRLARDDIAASMAHVRGLERGGLLTTTECDSLLDGLARLSEEVAAGSFPGDSLDEDIHSAIERRVTELVGEVGGKLHAGRSRNDQVVTALRLFTRRSLSEIGEDILGLIGVLARRADEAGEAYLPGYTHLQRAQPVLVAHYLLAHCWRLLRDCDRLLDCRDRLNTCPLGAGALAGSSLPLDPDGVAEELGFARRFENSLDAVSDRDFVAESLFVLCLLGVHLSGLGEEIALYATEEFGFVTLDDSFATGSSMLPQKKNPDVAELARAKAGRLIGDLTAVLVTLKGLPLAYNRDLQEDKEPLFDALDQIRRALAALAGLFASLRFNTEVMAAAADTENVVAVDLAEWLVSRGMPFRQAHGIVAGLVHDAIAEGVPLSELVSLHPDLGRSVLPLFEPGAAVRWRTTPGSTGPGPVDLQRRELDARVGSARRRLEDEGISAPAGLAPER